MKIIPKRNMHLDGRRVEQGKVESVSKSEGELALRHGWAIEADSDEGKEYVKGLDSAKKTVDDGKGAD